MQLKFGYSKNYFTELIKIEDFSTIEECLKMINEAFDDEDWEPLTMDQVGKKYSPKSNSKYVQLTGDGTLYFVDSLNEFNGKYNTEEGWGVEFWSDKVIY